MVPRPAPDLWLRTGHPGCSKDHSKTIPGAGVLSVGKIVGGMRDNHALLSAFGAFTGESEPSRVVFALSGIKQRL